MCEPTTLMAIGLALSAATTAVSFKTSSNAAKTQEEGLRQSAEMQNIQTAQGYEEKNKASMDASSQRYQEWLRDLGRLKTVGAESGLTGITEGRIEDEAAQQAQTDLATIEANRFKSLQSDGSAATAGSRRAGAELRSVKQPSLIGAGLQIAGAATTAAAGYRDRNPIKPKV